MTLTEEVTEAYYASQSFPDVIAGRVMTHKLAQGASGLTLNT